MKKTKFLKNNFNGTLLGVSILLFFHAHVLQSANPTPTDSIVIHNYNKLRRAQVESYSITHKLKDSIIYYNKLFTKSMGNPLNNSKEVQYRYFVIKTYGHIINGHIDSLGLLNKKITIAKLNPQQQIIIHRAAGVAYDHTNNITAALNEFLEGLEKSISAGLKDQTKVILIHIAYIIHNRFPDSPSWLKKKQAVLDQIIQTYVNGTNIEFEFEFIAKTPTDIIYNKIHPESKFYPWFKKDHAFVLGILDEVDQMKSQYQRYKETSTLNKILERYEQAVNYFKGRNKDHVLYYNLLQLYIKELISSGRYDLASQYIDQLNAMLPKDLGYDYFDYRQFYGSGITVYKILNKTERALYYTELDKTFNDNYALHKNQTFNYLVNYLNIQILKKIELEKTANRQKYIVIIAIIASILITIALFLILKIKNNRKLLKINEELTKSRNEALGTIEDNKKLEVKLNALENYITKDLNNNFGNSLSGVLHSFDVLKDISEKQKLDSELFNKFNKNFETSITKLTQDVKDLMWSTNNSNNSLYRLLEKLEDAAKKDVNISLQTVNKIKTDVEFPKFWNRQIYLIFKDLMLALDKNKLRSTMTLIADSNHQGHFTITCKNIFTDYFTNNTAMEITLSNMHKRSNSINGKLDVFSDGYNTTIVFTSGKRFNQLVS